MVQYNQLKYYEKMIAIRKLISKAHSVFLLYYRSILVVKYQKIFNDLISNREKAMERMF